MMKLITREGPRWIIVKKTDNRQMICHWLGGVVVRCVFKTKKDAETFLNNFSIAAEAARKDQILIKKDYALVKIKNLENY